MNCNGATALPSSWSVSAAPGRRVSPFRRAEAATIAGAFAIMLNSGVLALADLIPLQTARGGLLRLLSAILDGVVQLPHDRSFQFWFHGLVGLAMALFYAFALEPPMRGAPWLKGAIYALAVWLANAFIVLPLTGEGVAGSAHLTVMGMVWFAAAHTLFFVTLATSYPRILDGMARYSRRNQRSHL
jgi:hypothetical protein